MVNHVELRERFFNDSLFISEGGSGFNIIDSSSRILILLLLLRCNIFRNSAVDFTISEECLKFIIRQFTYVFLSSYLSLQNLAKPIKIKSN